MRKLKEKNVAEVSAQRSVFRPYSLPSIALLIFITSFFKPIYAQQELLDGSDQPDVNVLLKHQAVGGLSAHTEGWGFFYRRATIPSIYKKYFWEAEAVTMHDAHEYKMANPAEPEATPYYFGKLNGMEAIRFGIGESKRIWGKNDLNCIQVDAVFAIGASIAILKPVYLDILTNSPSGVPVAEEYDPNTDTPANIYGRASVFDGLGQLTFYPGGYGRAALNFDFSSRYTSVKAIELGLIVDAYDKQIPMMAFIENNQVFINLYLSFSLGKRWN